jgi:hypothetical protein|nr:MAG TPA: hypothetical protein [Bacteriophage sp.]
MRLPQTSSLLPAIYLRIIGNHTARIVAQSPTHIRREVQYEYVPILEMIFRIVLLENAFDSRIIMIIAFKLLPQNMYGTGFCLLNSLGFLHTYTSFSHGFTATKIYPCVRRKLQLYILCFIS